tara:strand:+ start:334 stop:753 length:420 start_codon:yes stop_codon:yes gene_type:complete
MKTFNQFINEGIARGSTLQGSGLSSEQIPHDIDDVDVKNKVNAILGHTAVSEYLNPQAAVEQMKAKLSQLGLNPQTADEELEFSEAGEFDLNFSRYGEIIGKTGNSEIDEIEKEEKVVSLNVRYEQLPNGSYKVYGSLV